jgi:hypothetical protein
MLASMRHRSTAAELLVLPLVLGLACSTLQATRVGEPSTLQDAIRVYRTSEGKKAMALAVDDRGRRAWGAFYKSKLQSLANEEALEECTRNAGRAAVDAPCHLLAEGDASSPETLADCRAGKVSRERCEAQKRYGPGFGG